MIACVCGGGNPQRCITYTTQMCLVPCVCLCVWFFFFVQIVLQGKFLSSVIENVRQYSLLELLTFWVAVSLWFFFPLSSHQTYRSSLSVLLDRKIRWKARLYLSLYFLHTYLLCLFLPFSPAIIVVFLGCPGSRYCLTKYFMHRVPANGSYLLER